MKKGFVEARSDAAIVSPGILLGVSGLRGTSSQIGGEKDARLIEHDGYPHE